MHPVNIVDRVLGDRGVSGRTVSGADEQSPEGGGPRYHIVSYRSDRSEDLGVALILVGDENEP